MKQTGLAALVWLASLPILAQPSGPGSALSFDGSGGYVSIATTGSLTGTFTVELWANPAENNATSLLALVGSRTPAEFGFDMKFWLGHLIHGDIGNGLNWLTFTADAEFHYTPGTWVHLAYVVTPTDYNIYANGQWMAGGNYPMDNPILYDASHQLKIGHIYASEFMKGQIDEVRIWNTARNQSEIQTNLQRRLTGSEAGLMGYWRFNEGSGPIVNDASGHGFLGLLFNGPVWVNSTSPIETLVATTSPASDVTPSSATLNGTVFLNDRSAGVWFEYGTTTNYGSATTVTQVDGSSGVPVEVSIPINGLLLGTVYHYRLVATNDSAISYGADSTFTASAVPLVVNGGFESGNLNGWTQSGNTSESLVGSGALAVHSGTYGGQFGPIGTLGYLSQTLPTIPGQSYLISFWLNSPDGQSPNEFSVAWNGVNLFQGTDLPGTDWTLMQFKANATTGSTVLQFGFRNDPSYLGLDDVSVVAIPAPEFLPSGPALTSGDLVLKWTSLAGQAYQLQYATSLEVSIWNDLGSPITATDSTTTALDAVGHDPQRFYRVILIP